MPTQVNVKLDNPSVYTNFDDVSGTVELDLASSENLEAVTVKLVGIINNHSFKDGKKKLIFTFFIVC